MNINRWILLFFATLVLGSGWIWMSRVPVTAQNPVRTAQPVMGYPAPEFTLETLDGGEFSLAGAPDGPLVVNFWATWCGPCRDEMPALQDAADFYDGRVQFVAVNQAEPADLVQPFVDELDFSIPVALDSEMEVARLYNVTGLPTTFFIDRNGVVRRVWLGEMNSITLAENIAGILP